MRKTVRVLVVLDYINSNSGVSSVVMNYYSNIDKAKVQMDFLLYENPDEDILEYLKGNGSNVYALGHPVKMSIGNYQKVIAGFFESHQLRYQIVHVHIPNAAFVVLKYAKKYGVETRIIHSHNSRGADGLVKKFRNYVLNKKGIGYATQYFACSKSAGKYLYGGKHLDEVIVINNAINLKKYRYDQKSGKKIRKELGIGDELVLGHVGRFSRQKNHEFLMEIASQLKERDIEFKLVLLGDGELQERIKEQVEMLGLKEQVIFVGVVNNAKEYMDAMDLFILPSLYEGLPCVCIEAQANGLPCLISENITREVALSDSVKFLGITDAGEWIDAILQMYDIQRLRQKREGDGCPDLNDYDIIAQAKILEERYLSYGYSSNINVDL